GLLVGKLVGVFGAGWLAIRLGWAEMPRGATQGQLFGTALLCGIGFTLSLVIGMLAFPDHPELQDEVKLGILAGSIVAGLAGWAVLRVSGRDVARPLPPARGMLPGD
ncbi:MAG: Na+/H+ antiporter NhaA, partial [Luteibacter sp.]